MASVTMSAMETIRVPTETLWSELRRPHLTSGACWDGVNPAEDIRVSVLPFTAFKDKATLFPKGPLEISPV